MSRPIAPRNWRTAVHRGLLAAALLASAAAVSGCGSKSDPLATLTQAQQTQLDAAWGAIQSATQSVDFTVIERASRAKTLYMSCKSLDKADGLLTAVDELCQPTYVVTKLDGVLPDRCASPSGQCVRALDRRADGTDQIVAALGNLTSQSGSAIAAPACRAIFATSSVMVQNYKNLASAYRVLSLGITQRDKDISGLGQRQVDGAKALISDRQTATQRMAAFRTACG